MNSKRYSAAERFPIVYRNLKENVASMGSYDLIISGDDNALLFLLSYKDDLFGPKVPVVFFGVNNHELAQEVAQKPDYTGIIENVSLLDTVELAFSLFHKTQTLHVIVDSTTSGENDLVFFNNSIPEFLLSRCKIEDLGEYSFDELGEILSGLGSTDAVLLLSAFRDKDGRSKNFRQAVMWLEQYCKRPVFHPYRHGVGEGLIGGKVVSHKEMAEQAAAYGCRILKGETIQNLPLIEDCGNIYLLDYSQLKYYGADMSALPEDTVFLNRPLSIYQRYPKTFSVFIAVFVLLLIFAVVLSFFFMRQRQTLLELEESEERTKSLFDNSFTPMLIIDPTDGSIVDANPSALQFYGYDHAHLLRLNVSDINSLPVSLLKEKMKSVEDGIDYKFQFQHRLANGEIRDVAVMTTKVYRKQKPLLFSIIQDNTERKAWEKEIIDAKNRAEAANNHKDEFLAMMSHEMRTPLNPILGFASLLLELETDPECLKYLQLISQSAERMLRLVDNILNYSKMRGGHFTPSYEDFVLLDFISGAIEEYKEYAQGNEIALVNGIDGCIPITEDLMVHTDKNMIHQLLDNLVGNSCKYTKNGMVKIHCALQSLEDGHRGVLRLEVHDNGIGISKDIQNSLFLPFTQEDTSFTRKYEGAGLGLAISREIVNILNGKIGLKSEQGKGSVFWFTVPVIVVSQSYEAEPSIDNSAEISAIEPFGSLLVVEDNADNSAFIKATLRKYCRRIDVAVNGLKAIEMTSANKYDLILMDLSMPVMDGITATKNIRRNLHYKSVPIIAFTAHATDMADRNAREIGIDEVLIKPISPHALSAALLKYLHPEESSV
ncbi:MAG: response regulator [Opitutales bacterium]|nr:response regulator [Opitutales bacterium]